MHKLRKVGVDILGGLLVIGAFLFGWLPGPGGIPMLLAGLGLLATNHDWAKRLLERAKNDGVRVAEMFFKDHPVLVIAYDIAAVLFLIAAVYVFAAFTNFVQAFSTVLFFVATGLFLGNRKRMQRLEAYIRTKRKK